VLDDDDDDDDDDKEKEVVISSDSMEIVDFRTETLIDSSLSPP